MCLCKLSRTVGNIQDVIVGELYYLTLWLVGDATTLIRRVTAQVDSRNATYRVPVCTQQTVYSSTEVTRLVTARRSLCTFGH